MSTTIPVQERVIDPFASYQSNAVNKLTELITHGEEGIVTISSLQVRSNGIDPDHSVLVAPGYIIKDNVLIKITQTHIVDFNETSNWVTPPGLSFAGGNCYLVLQYQYNKQRPAPQAYIKILQPTERHMLLATNSVYLLLKVVTLDIAAPHIITTLSDIDTEVGYENNKRQYLKYYAGGVVDLPAHNNNSDIGRIAYESSRDKFFFGHQSDWKELTAGGVSIDVNTVDSTGINIGTLCYINSNGIAEAAISTSTQTSADLCVIFEGTVAEGGRGIISGFAENVPVETGVAVAVGDIVYLSATDAGTVTGDRPLGLFQVVGRALTSGDENNPIDMIFSPKIPLALSVSGQITSWLGTDPYYQDIDVSMLDGSNAFDCHWFNDATDYEYDPTDVEIRANGQFIRVHVPDNTAVINYMIQSPSTTVGLGGGGGGSGGTVLHSLLLNLDYASSGHTGFAPTPHNNTHHSETYLTAADIATINADTLGGELPAFYRSAGNLNAGTISSDRGLLVSSSGSSFIRYTGLSRTNGAFYGGSTTPINSTRLNYDGVFYSTEVNTGNIYATNLIGNGSSITNLSASALSSGIVSGITGVGASSTFDSFLRFNAHTRSAGMLYGGTTDPITTTRLNYDGDLHVTSFTSVGTITSGSDVTFNDIKFGKGNNGHFSNLAIGEGSLHVLEAHNDGGGRGPGLPSYNKWNIGIGYRTLYNNTASFGVIAIGYEAMLGSLLISEPGYDNIAIGLEAMKATTATLANIAIGTQALTTHTSGDYNTVIGAYAASQSTIASNNTYVGAYTGWRSTTGGGNTGVGSSALSNVTTGISNVALGQESGSEVTSGGNNILIGHNAGKSDSPSGAITTQSNRVCVGNNTITNAHIQVTWQIPSDIRDKTNISSIPYGLSFINQINPISYQSKITRESDEGHGPVKYGFSAQEILNLEGDHPVIVDNENPNRLSLKDAAIIPILVNAIKELSAEIEILKKQLK